MYTDERELAMKVVANHCFGSQKGIIMERLAGKDEKWCPKRLCAQCFAATAGIPIFQEQLLQAAMDIADFTAAMADELRIALGKRDGEKIEQLRETFFKNGTAIGYDTVELEELFSEMERMAVYLYPRKASTNFSLKTGESCINRQFDQICPD